MTTRPKQNIVHIAIPTHDKNLCKDFYSGLLNATIAREYSDRVTFDFFGHQVVCHLDSSNAPNQATVEVDPFENAYPRHFGMTFLEKETLLGIHENLVLAKYKYLQPISSRFDELPERHITFFVADPTHNILEFKWYADSIYVY